jgi:hypothetical protein
MIEKNHCVSRPYLSLTANINPFRHIFSDKVWGDFFLRNARISFDLSSVPGYEEANFGGEHYRK